MSIDEAAIDEDALMEVALDLGADDISLEEGAFEVQTAPEAYHEVLKGLRSREIPMTSHDLAMIPSNTTQVSAEQVPSMLKLMELLEDHDDVQHVWTNLELDEAVLAEIS